MEDYRLARKKTMESKQVLRALVAYTLFNDEECFACLDLSIWWTAQAISYNVDFLDKQVRGGRKSILGMHSLWRKGNLKSF